MKHSLQTSLISSQSSILFSPHNLIIIIKFYARKPFIYHSTFLRKKIMFKFYKDSCDHHALGTYFI